VKLNLSTALSLLVGLAMLAAAYVSGFLKDHPDLTAVLVAVEQILSAFLPSALKQPDL
jgi:hypothetical protein